ncbi:hypothetical protein KIPB_013646 [Kipferlia bialata]|uniref:Uncharacterized protein n=1 Tax=Kipferlia bialata TaxID=797122 RepID=A0A9K3D9T6_9EUKA|nr:hypothetical protein KIPB_013646 [Kipferlia bialata]|eukprot:g13646.t1
MQLMLLVNSRNLGKCSCVCSDHAKCEGYGHCTTHLAMVPVLYRPSHLSPVSMVRLRSISMVSQLGRPIVNCAFVGVTRWDL